MRTVRSIEVKRYSRDGHVLCPWCGGWFHKDGFGFIWENPGEGLCHCCYKDYVKEKRMNEDLMKMEEDGDRFDMSDAKLFRRRPGTEVRMKKMDASFKVTTPNGVVRGKAGDFLAVDAEGGRYPIDNSVQAKTYEEI